MRVAQTNLQLYEQVTGFPEEDRLRIRDAYELVAELFAGQYRGSGKPFVAHLVGTASVLVRHGSSVDVVLAGVLHAAYQQGEFGTGRPGTTRIACLLLPGPHNRDLGVHFDTVCRL